MNSLALSDGVLLIAAIAIVMKSSASTGIRLSAAVFAAAAFLGVLRFSTLLPLPGMHSFFSGLGASAAYPLLAAAFLWPDSAVAQSWRFASIFLIIAGAFGLIASALDFSLWGNFLAIVAVVALQLRSLKDKDIIAAAGSSSLLAALLLFSSQFSLPPALQPGDFLHLFMALGLTLMATRSLRFPQQTKAVDLSGVSQTSLD
tara:strand:+ start:3890 stop:4495 length:606 start_codon:yes stop_codon:yes gene_type:complete